MPQLLQQLKSNGPLLLGGMGLFVALFGALDIVDLVGEEPRRALVAYEMLLRGDWWQPTVHGWPYYNKPPVFNWLIAAGFQLAGTPADWIVRLPSLLAYLLTAWALFRITDRTIGRQLAVWAALLYLSSGHLLFYATVFSGEMDLLVGLLVFGQAYAMYHGWQQQRFGRLFVGSYLLMAVGFLVKGLPSIAFQAITLVALAFYHRQWRWLFHPWHFLGAALGFGMIAAYFYSYELEYGNGWLYLLNLVEEASQKAAGESSILPILTHLVTFPLDLLVDLLPWSLLVLALWHRSTRSSLLAHPFLRFAGLFIAVNLPLYWISPEARTRYLYMFFPFFSLLFARLLLQQSDRIRVWAPRLVLLLIFGRLLFNYTYLPARQAQSSSIQFHRAIVEGISACQAAPDSLLYLRGQLDTIPIDPTIGPIALFERSLIVPPDLPYIVFLELSRRQQRVIPFDTIAQGAGTYIDVFTPSVALPAPPCFDTTVWDIRRIVVLPDGKPAVNPPEL